jgi:hypothetical protein
MQLESHILISGSKDPAIPNNLGAQETGHLKPNQFLVK